MALNLSTEDYRTSIPSAAEHAATNAPEVDNALLAPQCLGDNIAPEASPGQGPQVFYDTSPPEALQVRPPEHQNGPPPDDITPERNSRKKLIILSLTVTALIAVALGVGLTLGLRSRGKGDVRSPATLPSTSTTLIQP
ncbi:MAG: hypothetical protein Q9207_006758, partial [Kuettlingeria erythrocarpa]